MTTKLTVGINDAFFNQASAEAPGITARRIYLGTPNGFGVPWPSPDGPSLVSIRPVPGDLTAGRLDNELHTLLEGAPEGSRVNAWHEAGNLVDYDSEPYSTWVTPANMKAVHIYMQNFMRRYYPEVLYGPVLCMHPGSMPDWMPPGMDFYADDIYNWSTFDFKNGALDRVALTIRLANWKSTCARLNGGKPQRLVIAETNSGDPDARGAWFTEISTWLAANGGDWMSTFWGQGPGTVGPWIEDEPSVTNALNAAAALDCRTAT